MNDRSQHRLLTGLVRLVAVFYLLKSIDQSIGSLSLLFFQLSQKTEGGTGGFAILALATPVFYVLLTVAVFSLAPRLARICLGPAGTETTGEASSPVRREPIVLFGIGILVTVYAFSLITDGIYFHVASRMNRVAGFHYPFEQPEQVRLLLHLALFGTGMLLMLKCHRVAAWLEDRQRFTTTSTERQDD